MRYIIYNICFFIVGILLLPHYYIKMKRRGGYKDNFKNRFGIFTPSQLRFFEEGDVILIHAVSVGEVGVAFQFIEAMRKKNPGMRFVVSTTSSTGWKEAEKRQGALDGLIYLPLDLPVFVSHLIRAVRPKAFIMVETEIWPNLIRCCSRNKIPMAIINGRLSDKTAPAYRRLRFLFGPALRAINLISVQSELDATRFIAAGANPKSVKINGSFKFDVAKRNPQKEEMWHVLLNALGLSSPNMILLGASTWDGEEKIFIETYQSLLKEFPSLRLILIPRHFERRDAVEEVIASFGYKSVRKSDLDSGKERIRTFSSSDILLADTTGEMMGLFPFASVTVVGRTFRSKGGQNMIEPCLCAVPTIVGPQTQNFRPVMADLLSSKAIIQLKSENELVGTISELLQSETKRKALGVAAMEAVLKRKGVINASVGAVNDLLNTGASN